MNRSLRVAYAYALDFFNECAPDCEWPGYAAQFWMDMAQVQNFNLTWVVTDRYYSDTSTRKMILYGMV